MIESPRHDLDAAIDRVAERMVAVPEDISLLARTMARLPERQATPWFLAMRVQLAAAAAVVLVAFLFARPSRDAEVGRVSVAEPAATSIPDVRIPEPGPRIPVVHAVASRLPTPDSRLPIERREDHERSLAPIDAIDALELVGIASPAMEVDAAAALEPLVLPELALDTKGDK